MPNHQTIIGDVLELAELYRPHWPALRASIPAWHPRNDEETAEEKEAREKAEADAAAKAEADKAAEEAKRKAAEDALGDAGKAALDAERKARRDAEKRAKEAERKAKEYEDAQLSETERLKKQAEEAEAKVATATAKAQRANLLTALGEQGLTGAKAKAAVRLLDDVEFDDDDEPTNLKEAIEAATAEYGEDVFKGATPAAGSADQGARGNPPPDKPKTLKGAIAAQLGGGDK